MLKVEIECWILEPHTKSFLAFWIRNFFCLFHLQPSSVDALMKMINIITKKLIFIEINLFCVLYSVCWVSRVFFHLPFTFSSPFIHRRIYIVVDTESTAMIVEIEENKKGFFSPFDCLPVECEFGCGFWYPNVAHETFIIASWLERNLLKNCGP